MREIKVIANSQNKNEVYMSEANTFGELKAELINKGYEVVDMDFKEGKSRIDLKDDFSPLPSNFMYKGELTSDLVIMITPANTKIKSGAYDREQLYRDIKRYNLQEVVRNEYGKNYTNCSNVELSTVINEYESTLDEEPSETPQLPTSEDLKPIVREVVNEELDKRESDSEFNLNSIARCMLKIIDFIDSIHLGSHKLVPTITCNNWKKSIRKDYEPYSQEDLDSMMH